MELKKYKLGDIAEILISSIDKKSKDGEPPVRLCNFVDVYRNWAITEDLAQNFMVATANENNIKRFSLKKGYVAFTKDSETRDDIGIPAFIADDLANTVLGYHCALVKPNTNILSGKYLNAFLHSDYIKKYFELNATGSGMRYTLSIDALDNIPILAPSLKKQEHIGNIFSDIDKKICLNRAINDNLRASRVQSQTKFGLCPRQSEFSVAWPFIKRGKSSLRCLVNSIISQQFSMISANIESNLFLKSAFGQTNTNNSFKSLSERCPTVEPFALNSLAFM